MLPNFSHKVVETDKRHISWKTLVAYQSHVCLRCTCAFYQRRLTNFAFKGVISITGTNYIKVLYFMIFMAFFNDMLYEMRFSFSTIMVKYFFWQLSCRFSNIIFWALTFWTFDIINSIMLMFLYSFILYLGKFAA